MLLIFLVDDGLDDGLDRGCFLLFLLGTPLPAPKRVAAGLGLEVLRALEDKALHLRVRLPAWVAESQGLDVVTVFVPSGQLLVRG